MARILIAIEDATGEDGSEGMNVEIRSVDPPFATKDGGLDPDKSTKAQLMAFGALMEIAGLGNAELLIRAESQGLIDKQEDESE